jgi:hypothetical protein
MSNANVSGRQNFKMRNSHRCFSMTYDGVCAGMRFGAQFTLNSINDLDAGMRSLFI